MASNIDVLMFLRPDGGYSQSGQDYEGITFIDCEPFTEQEYAAAFAQVDTAKAEAQADKETKRAAALTKLSALGLTTDDLKALGLGGN